MCTLRQSRWGRSIHVTPKRIHQLRRTARRRDMDQPAAVGLSSNRGLRETDLQERLTTKDTEKGARLSRLAPFSVFSVSFVVMPTGTRRSPLSHARTRSTSPDRTRYLS